MSLPGGEQCVVVAIRWNAEAPAVSAERII